VLPEERGRWGGGDVKRDMEILMGVIMLINSIMVVISLEYVYIKNPGFSL
jgi:hypothetical protein